MRLILLSILISFLLISCSEKHWQQRGMKKGWLDTTQRDSTRGIILPDTSKENSVINDFADSITTDVTKECPNIDSTEKVIIREKIRYRTKESFIPQYLDSVYHDTIIYNNGAIIRVRFNKGKFDLDVNYPKQVIKPGKPCYDRFWRGFGIGAVSLFIFMLGAYKVFKL